MIHDNGMSMLTPSLFFFFSSRRRHTRYIGDWSSDVCSSDLNSLGPACLLFTKEFYTLVRDRLTERGVMTMQAGMTKVNEIFFFSAVNRTLREDRKSVV